MLKYKTVEHSMQHNLRVECCSSLEPIINRVNSFQAETQISTVIANLRNPAFFVEEPGLWGGGTIKIL